MEYIEAYADLKADSAEGFANPIMPVTEEHPANIRISRRPDMDGHYLFLDLDVPHEYVPSSTPGHGHLIVDVRKLDYAGWNARIGKGEATFLDDPKEVGLTIEEVVEILSVLAKHGIVEPGFVASAELREAASLRLPHVKKEAVDVA